MEWNKTFGTVKDEEAFSIIQSSDGGYVVVGWTGDVFEYDTDMLIIKIDAFGNKLWDKTYNILDIDFAVDVIEITDGYVVVGCASKPGLGGTWLARLDISGNVEWDSIYKDFSVSKLLKTADGGYVLIGDSSYPMDFCLLKVDSAGNIEWRKTFGGTGIDCAVSAVTTVDGGFVIAGHTFSFGAGMSDVWLVKTDTFGNIVWNLTYGGMSSEWGCSIVQVGGEEYVVAGYTCHDLLLIKVREPLSWSLAVIVHDWDGTGAALAGGDTWVELIRHGEVSGVTRHIDDCSRAVFYDVEPGTYYANVWHRPSESDGLTEFWAQKTNIIIEEGKSATVEVVRHYPVITNFEVQQAPAKTGEPATITVTIKNIDSIEQWVKAKLIIKHESGEWVYQNESASQKLQPEQEATFTFSDFKPEKEGAYYGLAMCKIMGGGEQATDIEGWTYLFTIGFPQPPREVRLNVPYQSQDETGWCAVTSLAMVLRYYGYYYHSWDIADDMDLSTYTGVNLKQLYDYVRERFPSLTSQLGIYSEKTLKILDDVRGNITLGYPVILALKLEEVRHAIVVVGYNDTGFFIHDPDRVLCGKESLKLYISNEGLYELIEAPNSYGTLLLLKGEIPTNYVFTGSSSLSRRTVEFEGGPQIQLSDIYMKDVQNGDFHYLDLDRGLLWKVNGVDSGIDMWDELRVYINVANNMGYSQSFKVKLIILGEDGKAYYEKEETTEEIPKYHFRFHQSNISPWLIPLYNLPKTQNYRIILELYNQTGFKVDTFYTPYFYYTANYKCVVNVENHDFHVTIDSNSIISNFTFSKDDKKLAFTIDGEEGASGYINLTVPVSLLGGPYTIAIDGNTLIKDFDAPTNATYAFIYFTYTHSQHLIEITGTTVISEFPSILILLALMILAVITVAIRKTS